MEILKAQGYDAHSLKEGYEELKENGFTKSK
jgi:hypothetical protein